MYLNLSKIDKFTESVSHTFLKYIINAYKWYINYIKNAKNISYFFKYNNFVT